MKIELEITEEQKLILIEALEDKLEDYFSIYQLAMNKDWEKENKKLFNETEKILKQVEGVK